MAAPQRTRVGDPVVRQRVLSIAVMLVLVLFAARLVDIQGVRADALSEQALKQRLVTREVTTPRADIVDRNGVVLATTVDRYNIGVNQKLLAKWMPKDSTAIAGTGAIEAAKILAPILGIDEKELAAKLVGDSTWVYIAKDVTPEVWDLVDAEGISGIEPEQVSQRIYPNGAIAGNVIGFVGGLDTIKGTTGVAGLEREFQDELTGIPGSETFENGGSGTLIPTGVHTEIAAGAREDAGHLDRQGHPVVRAAATCGGGPHDGRLACDRRGLRREDWRDLRARRLGQLGSQ